MKNTLAILAVAFVAPALSRHQPYSDKLICNGDVSGNFVMVATNRKRFTQCPQLTVGGSLLRLDDGSRVYTVGSNPWTLDPEQPGVHGGSKSAPSPAPIEITKLR